MRRTPGPSTRPALRPEGPREICALFGSIPAEVLAALQAAMMGCLFFPGHRPPASALGWVLPTRWAGFDEALGGTLRLGIGSSVGMGYLPCHQDVSKRLVLRHRSGTGGARRKRSIAWPACWPGPASTWCAWKRSTTPAVCSAIIRPPQRSSTPSTRIASFIGFTLSNSMGSLSI